MSLTCKLMSHKIVCDKMHHNSLLQIVHLSMGDYNYTYTQNDLYNANIHVNLCVTNCLIPGIFCVFHHFSMNLRILVMHPTSLKIFRTCLRTFQLPTNYNLKRTDWLRSGEGGVLNPSISPMTEKLTSWF